jgi:proline iminopeptidase
MDVINETLQEPGRLIPFALFEVVYMLNGGFMRRGQILDDVHKIVAGGHKVQIVHGRADYVCQPKAAYQLYRALRNAGCTDVALEFVAGAGHSDSEPGLTDAIVRATNSVRDIALGSMTRTTSGDNTF